MTKKEYKIYNSKNRRYIKNSVKIIKEYNKKFTLNNEEISIQCFLLSNIEELAVEFYKRKLLINDLHKFLDIYE